MHPREFVQILQNLENNNLTSEDLTRLHHFSLSGRKVNFHDVINYFQTKRYFIGNNIGFSQRCKYVSDNIKHNATNIHQLIDDAILKFPLNRPAPAQPAQANAPFEPNSLGDRGEAFVLQLLHEHGYTAKLLRRNYPTYDIQVVGPEREFFVSVKTARKAQQVRLGTRASVNRLSQGNFVFALMPAGNHEIEFLNRRYTLLILPADMVKRDSLMIHDAYWAVRAGSGEFSVMVKANNPSHKETWERWRGFTEAWNIMPGPNPAVPNE